MLSTGMPIDLGIKRLPMYMPDSMHYSIYPDDKNDDLCASSITDHKTLKMQKSRLLLNVSEVKPNQI